jgi:quercetin dioxygenase-like cupin family protein
MHDSDSSTPIVVPDLAQKGHDLLDNEHEGIQSAVLHGFEGKKTHLFAIPEGETFPTHDTHRHVMIHVVDGRARITLGDDETTAAPNAWIYMPPNLPHSLEALTPFVFTLHVEPVDSQ